MTLPSVAIGAIVGLLIGALFHIGVDGGGGRLALYLLLGLFGFFSGHLIGSALNWRLLPLGPLDMGMAVLGSVLFLGVGHWLSLIEIGRPQR